MRPQDLATAKTVAKISVVSNMAAGRRAWHADPPVLTIPHQLARQVPGDKKLRLGIAMFQRRRPAPAGPRIQPMEHG
jgi:hypothetical protein